MLSLIDIAEEFLGTKIDKMKAIENAILGHFVYFNFENYDDENNFYVTSPEFILKMLTGKKWSVRKENADYVKKDDEFVVEFWSKNFGKSGHFARIEKGFNSLQSSLSVKNGKIHSFRVFKVL